MSTPHIGRKLQPFVDRGVEPDSPHMSGKETELSQQTQIICYRAGGTCRHWVKPHPGVTFSAVGATFNVPVAPTALMGAVDTWYDFKTSGTSTAAALSFQVPWRFTEQRDAIYVQATLACEADVFLSFRCNTQTMVTAVATTNGSQWSAQPVSQAPKMYLWDVASQADKNMIRTAQFASMIKTPTMPADRRVVLVPQIMVRQDRYDLFTLAAPGTVKAWLVDMQAFDLMENP